MHRSLIHFAAVFTLCVCLSRPLPTRAGIETRAQADAATSSDFPFELGAKEFQIMAGPFYSFSKGATTFNFALISLRIGWMVSPLILNDGPLRGTFELLGDAVGGPIYDGPGSGLGGALLHLRYNYVQPGARWVPYLQAGVGGVYSDASQDRNQRLVGSEFEFCIQAGGGLRCLINERWAINGEVLYTHISNANLGDRNVGVNAVGGTFGVSFFF
jgi:lipid A 3-O-deacylase